MVPRRQLGVGHQVGEQHRGHSPGDMAAAMDESVLLSLLNGLDVSSVPALRDWLQGHGPEPLMSMAAQSLAVREGLMHHNWDLALTGRPECLLDLPDTSTEEVSEWLVYIEGAHRRSGSLRSLLPEDRGGFV